MSHMPVPTPPRLQFCALVATLILVGAPGCSRQTEDEWTRRRPKTFPVSGTVLVGGKAVEGVKVQFERPATGTEPTMVAFGLTDSRGRFVLRTFRDGDGAVAGTHAVLIERLTFETLPKAPGQEVAATREVSHLPEKYRSANTSGLTATVKPGERNEFSFSVE